MLRHLTVDLQRNFPRQHENDCIYCCGEGQPAVTLMTVLCLTSSIDEILVLLLA